jgi:hypothetical protein
MPDHILPGQISDMFSLALLGYRRSATSAFMLIRVSAFFTRLARIGGPNRQRGPKSRTDNGLVETI